MAKSVNQAFNEFLKETVNLDPDVTVTARKSRDWLIAKISEFPTKDIDFPKLYNEIDIHFGSFARKTKIRELDDIDIMIGLAGQGSTYIELDDKIEIHVSSQATNLLKLCHDGTSTLNSKRVVNRFVSAFKNVPNYKRADIKRNQEAATVKLVTHSWNFDIVPCFITLKSSLGEPFYLIPDGNGDWKKTNPLIDRARTSTTNQNHNGNVLKVIRIMKYWNKRATMPTMSSYLLETMILDYYESQYSKASDFVDLEIANLVSYIYKKIMNDVYDPKGMQGNINHLSYDEKTKIKNKALIDHNKIVEARQLETELNMAGSIQKWREIFGDSFPRYE